MDTLKKAIETTGRRVYYYRPVIANRCGCGAGADENLWLNYLLVDGDREALNRLPIRIMPLQSVEATDILIEIWRQRIAKIQIEIFARKDARSWAAAHRGANAEVVGGALQGLRGTIGEMSGERSVYMETDFTSRVSVKITELEICE